MKCLIVQLKQKERKIIIFVPKLCYIKLLQRDMLLNDFGFKLY